MSKQAVFIVLATVFALSPAPAQAWSCADKADGQWCHNNEIWICDNGGAVFTDPCLYGCSEGAGPNATCSPPPCTGFCCGKSNGKYCNGNTLTTCTGQATTNTKTCSDGCVSNGSSSYCAAAPCSGYCCGKADGEWCHNNDLWICDNDADVFVDDCLYGCNEGAGPDANCAPKPCDGYCCGKANGEWCHGGEIFICQNEEDLFADPCLYGCTEGDGPDADCAPKPCSGYCCDKEDGEWCHLGEILICVGDEDVFADPCLGGCVEGEGPDADCLPSPGFCKDKADGIWCDGKMLRTCQGGVVTTWDACLLTCVGEGPQAACSEEGFCIGKQNGLWCHDGSGHLIECQGGAAEDLVECDAAAPCEHMPPGDNDVCEEVDPNQPPEETCVGKPDTDTCWEDVLVSCQGEQVLSWIPCPAGCEGHLPDGPDVCADLVIDPQFCADKADYWCYEDAAVIWCSGGIVAAVEECLNSCDPQEDGHPDLCEPEDPGLFCSHHGQGAWCNGLYELVSCNPDGSLGAALPCDAGCVKAPFGQDDECPGPAGCEGSGYAGAPLSVVVGEDCCPVFVGSKVLDVPIFNQLDYTKAKAEAQGDKHKYDMGTCTGKTIGSWGCLITSLSMWYEYAGVQRDLNGAPMANTPPKENKWRTQNGGYLGCADDQTCCMWYTTWFPEAMNPPGFGSIGETGNVPPNVDDPETPAVESCLLGFMAAKVIAAELNSGSPLVAHVQGSNTSQHYVLIVGVSGGELVLNDPGGGVKGGAFSSGAGFGPYSNLHSVYYRGGIGMGGGIPPWYDEPVLPEGSEDPMSGGTVFTAEGQEKFAELFEPVVESQEQHDPGGSGCAAGPGSPGALGVLLGLLFVAWIRCRRILHD